MAQPMLIEYTKDEVIQRLGEALKKYGKHTLYCCWIDSHYDNSLGCTCGLQDALNLISYGEVDK